MKAKSLNSTTEKLTNKMKLGCRKVSFFCLNIKYIFKSFKHFAII